MLNLKLVAAGLALAGGLYAASSLGPAALGPAAPGPAAPGPAAPGPAAPGPAAPGPAAPGPAAPGPAAPAQFPQPHKYHKLLQADVGVWDGELEMSVPGMPEPMKSEVVETIKTFGSFWTVSTLEGNFMGMPFEGHAQLGYDPEAKQFVGTWIDTSSPSIAVMHGSFDEDTKTLAMHFRAPDMMGRMTDQWNTSTVNEAGQRIFKGFFKAEDGSDVHSMTIVYTKRPAEASTK
jgi:Protein of unknown function (DUF1579)